MARLFSTPRAQFFDGNGDPYSGGKLNFYQTGTTTRLDTYSDNALTTANANPVVADANGNFGAIFMQAQDYKVVLTDTDDVVVWTQDPVHGKAITSTVISKTGAYTVTTADDGKLIECDASGGDFTVTLPAAATAGDGFEVSVKNVGSSGTVTIDGDGAETIDGATTLAIATQYDGFTVRSDATEWLITGAFGNASPLTQTEADALYIAQGTHTIWMPAGAMRPTVSNGCATLADTETTAGRPDISTLDFDATSDEHAQFSVPFPKSWDEGTITYRVFWTSTATDTDGVTWALQGVAVSDGDTIDVAYGTAVTVDDANQSTAEDLYVTAVSGAVTIAGTPAVADLVYFRIFRDVSDANDTAAEDAKLIGVQIFYTVNAGDDS